MKNKRLVDDSVIGLFEPSYYALFDFETTGLHPPKDKPIQLAYILLNQNLQITNAKNFYFEVQEEVPEAAIKIHGLTKAKLIQLGAKPYSFYVHEIQHDFSTKYLLSIAHNAGFDIRFMRHFFLQQKAIPYWCTMKYYTNIIRLPGLYDDYKWPKVSETMQFLKIDEEDALKTCKELFQSSSIGYHDARFDIVCIYKMIQNDYNLRREIQSVSQKLIYGHK
ncbi:MAG: 3'-5' exonuclease [Caldisericia bacterium]|nr:3'-5' exonuclease [Caldisericia bacterium]MDD4614075.1 3'-5' exonuclease [Caldisericia bacterium]